jgi:hypothetical protein
MRGHGMSKCRVCGARVFWAFDEDGRSVGMDAKPCADGDLTMDRSGIVERGRSLSLRERHGQAFREHNCGGER